jgi:uncharacterized protein (UPF0276 family)
MPSSDFSSLPFLGAGVGLRKEHFRELKSGPHPAWLEIIPENFMNFGGYPQAVLDYCARRWPMVSHGVNLSIGGTDPLDEEYLERLEALLGRVRALWFSDHLCFTRAGGDYLHDLLPLPFTREAADHAAARVKKLKKKIKLPFLLENPSYYVAMPGADMDEADFFTRVLEEADCGLLLDVNNVYVNARNHGFDPRGFIRRLPLDRVAQIHLAGHEDRGDVVVDTHQGPIIDPVWDLYRFTLEAVGRPVSTLIEWDTAVPPLKDVAAEADRARAVMEKLGLGGAAPRAGAEGEGDAPVPPARSPLAERREAAGAR